MNDSDGHFNILCSVCKFEMSIHAINLFDDRYGYRGLFEIYSCSNCGHKSLREDFSPEQLKKLYTDYYPRSTFDLNQYEPAKVVRGFSSWLNGERCEAYSWVPENVRILDIGCGFGESLGYHKARGCDVFGVEADENIKGVANKYGFNVHVGLFDPGNYEPDFFDYVTMDQVIEHVTDPLATLRGIARILKPGGIAILSTPNATGWAATCFGRKWINWHAPYHLQHFSLKSMKLAAEQAGMALEKARTITSSEWIYYQWIHILTFPEMGTPSVFWSPLAKPSFKDKVMLQVLRLIHRSKIHHILTRLSDALNAGDNFLFFLRKK